MNHAIFQVLLFDWIFNYVTAIVININFFKCIFIYLIDYLRCPLSVEVHRKTWNLSYY